MARSGANDYYALPRPEVWRVHTSEQHRTISIREAARIQSFPDWFVFEGNYSQQYDQVGNAVPPLLAKAVGMELREMLSGRKIAPTASVKSRYVIPEDRHLALA
jgi:DNA (cytosine-5)-methyltransferase 1